MNQVNLLRQTLKPLLGWHGARLSFLALFIIALLRVKTVNLVELATVFRNHAKTDSNFKRLQRFFRDFDLDYSVIAQVIVRMMDIPQPWVLSTDRTEWSFGKTRFNILMLGIVHNGVAYPLVWEMLDKKGNSNGNDRMDLVDRFYQIFPDAQIAYLTGDREFVGKQWLTYLLIEPIISFRFRIRKSDRICDGKKALRASIIFANLKPGQTQILSGRRWVWGRSVYVSALRLEDGELLIVVSPDSSQTAISDYAKRWGIETLFGMFKTRGFCLESTHFTDLERLSKLLALMSLTLCWAIKIGDWLHQHQPIKIKKHGRLTKSIFRHGLDYLRSIVTDLDLKHDDFCHSLQFLSCT
ncbi:transposase IS4 family protein [Stanieria sp. NIES-3757]|nr:transposase IS4 family protein [Stanieria sp. NIES-3757]BAU64274.1 transposase IS4 family protein [Stanieria sp. NIES-3757]BAU67253.1 transposase IS4 family protein [Stanieria sp. NIES-3757]